MLWGALILVGCGGTKPQRPTRLGEERLDQTDSMLLGMVEVNQQMAEEADSQLAAYAADGYAYHEDGYWVKGLKDTDQPRLADSSMVMVHQWVYDLNGTLYQDVSQEMMVGRLETMPAVMSVLSELHHGDSVSLLIPWYAGYGAQGQGVVPAYTNVRVELVVK